MVSSALPERALARLVRAEDERRFGRQLEPATAQHAEDRASMRRNLTPSPASTPSRVNSSGEPLEQLPQIGETRRVRRRAASASSAGASSASSASSAPARSISASASASTLGASRSCARSIGSETCSARSSQLERVGARDERFLERRELVARAQAPRDRRLALELEAQRQLSSRRAAARRCSGRARPRARRTSGWPAARAAARVPSARPRRRTKRGSALAPANASTTRPPLAPVSPGLRPWRFPG